MGCGGSKEKDSTESDNFQVITTDTHLSPDQTKPSAEGKVYRNYTTPQEKKQVIGDSESESDESKTPAKTVKGRGSAYSYRSDNSSEDEEYRSNSEAERGVRHVNHRSQHRTDDEYTSEEEKSTPLALPTTGSNSRHEKGKSDFTSEPSNVDRQNVDDYMTPVVMGHKNHVPNGHSNTTITPSTTSESGIKPREDLPPASVETQMRAIIRMQKLFRQRKHWKRVIEEREWKIFNDLDTQDEADMLNLACFFQTLLDWNTGSGQDIVNESPSHKALQQSDSDCEDYDHNSSKLAKLKRDSSIRKAQLHSISVHSSSTVYGNTEDFAIPKGSLNSKVAHDIISVYKKKGRLNLKSIQKILRFSYKNFKKLKTMSHIHIEKGEKVTVVGDLHGQLGDLFHILEESGWPSPTNKYVFNGDFVDRGEQGVEVVCVLLSLFAAMPECVYLNRGNHEDHAICCVYGFEKEVKEKYDELTFGMFVEIFRHIPLFTVINKEVFIVHGGLFHDVNVKIEDLEEIDRTDYAAKPPIPYPECCDGLGSAESRKEYLKQLQRDALWSDPNEFEVLSKNSRGSGVVFGPEVTRRFLKNNKLRMIVRSHECVRRGFDQPFSGAFEDLLCTVFSASNYCGGHNDAAYMTFSCHEMSGGHAIPRSNCDLHYNVHHFNLSDAKQSLRDANHDNIRDLILRKSKALQQAFEIVDMKLAKAVTKTQFSEIMQRVTNLKILWLAILKDLCPQAENGNFVNYVTFLKSMRRSVGDTNSMSVDSLYGQRQKLETIFHFFDKNNDGTISREEFRKGCDFMNTTLPPESQLKDYDHILTLMDFDQSDSIDINEFFEVFRILDAKDGVVDGVISIATNAGK